MDEFSEEKMMDFVRQISRAHKRALSYEEREDDMLRRYGECCKRVVAAKILGCSVTQVASMIKDGRLTTACEGKMVDVRSIARYIVAPEQEDFEARQRRRREKTGCRYVV